MHAATFEDNCILCLAIQSCPSLCDPMDCSQPGSSVHGIFQVRILEWAAISSPRGSSWPKGWICVSCIAGRFFYCWEAPLTLFACLGFPGWSAVKKLPAIQETTFNVGDTGSIPRSERYPWEGNGSPLQYSYLGNPMDRGAWQATVHAVARVRLNLAITPSPPFLYWCCLSRVCRHWACVPPAGHQPLPLVF